MSSVGLEVLLLVYLCVQGVYVVLTRLSSSVGAGGLAILPYSLMAYAVLTFLFIWLSGWHRDAHGRMVAGWRLPVPSRETAISGIGSAMMLGAIPMSVSIPSVSIPIMLLILRGGMLAIAPLVDLAHRRRIHWWSGVALVAVAGALTLALRGNRDVALSPLAVLTVLLYNVGFLLRLVMMTRVAKRGSDAQTRNYFVEEKLVALPLGLVTLLLLVAAGAGSDNPSAILHVNWSLSLALAVLCMGVALTITSILASVILLDRQENSYCVPLERATGLLAGFGAAWVLHWMWQRPAPTPGEMWGAALVLGTIVLLALARPARRRA